MNFSVKAKLLKIKSEGVRHFCPSQTLFILIFLIGFHAAYAQVENPVKAPKGSLPATPDSLKRLNSLDSTFLNLNKSDSLKADSLKIKADSTGAKKRKGDIETTIFYSAVDSLNSSLDKKIVKLYGDAKIKYGDIELEADIIVIDYEQSTITANAGTDSLGNRIGYPIFKNGKESYETRDMVYNFKTKKAKISEVVTKQGEGFLHGERVFKNEKNELFSTGNGYTTCNLAHPHFRIVSTRIKAIPGNKMISGPFYMEFMDVPTPIGFLFGIFPSQRKSSSGILVPTYGEESNRGFYLRNGGYYFDINDFIKIGLTGDIYSKGSSALYVNSSYKKRYKYNGSFSIGYTNNHTTYNIESPIVQKDFRLTWSHSPQSRGTGRFSASVTAATTSYTSNNYLGALANTAANSTLSNGTSNMSSNISYSKTIPNTPFSLGINMRHNQNLTTKILSLNLPDITLNVNNIYPFKRVKGSLFLQNLSTRVTGNITNQFSNDLGNIGHYNKSLGTNGFLGHDSASAINGSTFPMLLRNAKNGAKFTMPFTTSVKVAKFITLTPSLNITDVMYLQHLNWEVAPIGNTFVKKDTVKGFNNIFNYTGGVNATTRLYGFKAFKKGRLQAIRHIVNPSIGLSFNPDFSAAKYHYFQRFDQITNTPTASAHTVVYKDRYDGFIVGSSTQGKSQSMSFGINNNIEMKIKGKNDTIAKKIPLFNTLSINSSYNFGAPIRKLSPFNLSANTNILDNKVNLSLSGVITPYKYHVDSLQHTDVPAGSRRTIYQHQSNYVAWNDGKFSLGQLSSFSFAFSTNLNPKGQAKDNVSRDKIAKSNLSDGDKQYLIANPDTYVDFSIPWNLRLNYNFSYSKTGFQPSSVTQGVRFTGDVSLSTKWKIVFGSGYDFKSNQFTQTNLSMNRELHCWQMIISWVPFGKFQSYSFTIAVKSAMLRDLKLVRTRPFQDTY